jgi:hypothetical protein
MDQQQLPELYRIASEWSEINPGMAVELERAPISSCQKDPDALPPSCRGSLRVICIYAPRVMHRRGLESPVWNKNAVDAQVHGRECAVGR